MANLSQRCLVFRLQFVYCCFRADISVTLGLTPCRTREVLWFEDGNSSQRVVKSHRPPPSEGGRRRWQTQRNVANGTAELSYQTRVRQRRVRSCPIIGAQFGERFWHITGEGMDFRWDWQWGATGEEDRTDSHWGGAAHTVQCLWHGGRDTATEEGLATQEQGRRRSWTRRIRYMLHELSEWGCVLTGKKEVEVHLNTIWKECHSEVMKMSQAEGGASRYEATDGLEDTQAVRTHSLRLCAPSFCPAMLFPCTHLGQTKTQTKCPLTTAFHKCQMFLPKAVSPSSAFLPPRPLAYQKPHLLPSLHPSGLLTHV